MPLAPSPDTPLTFPLPQSALYVTDRVTGGCVTLAPLHRGGQTGGYEVEGSGTCVLHGQPGMDWVQQPMEKQGD